MVNKALVKQSFDDIDALHVNNPHIDVLWAELLEALGDNEDDIIEYINNLSDKDAFEFNCIYEELVEKFPSDEMEDLFEKKVYKNN